MRADVQRRRAASVLAAAGALTLVSAAVARAEAPEVGGSVPSVLSMSIGEPSAFTVGGRGRGGSRLYTTTINFSVTATVTPTRLSIADGEATVGKRYGHLVNGTKILFPALEAAAGRARYRSLASAVDPQLGEWSEPLGDLQASIHLRQEYTGSATGLARFQKLLLVTVTAGGP